MTSPATPHLLVVDDDRRLRSLVERYLARNNCWCSCARDARHAANLIRLFRFDLVVMDIMMPGMDGIAFTRELRKSTDVPVIVLSARTGPLDRIEGLGAGADDYMEKPFEPKELLLRIKAVLRRTRTAPEHSNEEQSCKLGNLEFFPARGALYSGSERVHLTEFEVQLLRRLHQTPNRAVDRSEFVGFVEEGTSIQERAIDVRISRLRQKIEEVPRRPRFLHTVRGRGYMLVPD